MQVSFIEHALHKEKMLRLYKTVWTKYFIMYDGFKKSFTLAPNFSHNHGHGFTINNLHKFRHKQGWQHQ